MCSLIETILISLFCDFWSLEGLYILWVVLVKDRMSIRWPKKTNILKIYIIKLFNQYIRYTITLLSYKNLWYCILLLMSANAKNSVWIWMGLTILTHGGYFWSAQFWVAHFLGPWQFFTVGWGNISVRGGDGENRL